jgi:hypothetical protein
MSGDKPRAPFVAPIPRGSGEMRAVVEENVGPILSLPPPPIDPEVERKFRSFEDNYGTRLKTLEDEFRGQKAGIEQHIKTTVETSVKTAVELELRGVTKKLDAIGVETFEQSGVMKNILAIVRRERLASISDQTAELELTEKEQNVFSGKGRRLRLWIKSGAVLVFIFVALGSALGISRCSHVHGIELPE